MLAKLSFVGALACTASAFGGPDVIPSIDENGMLISKVVANDFVPGDSFQNPAACGTLDLDTFTAGGGVQCCSGWTLSDGLVGIQHMAQQWVASSSSSLCSIDLVWGHVTGPNSYNVSLYSDAGGAPGSAIATAAGVASVNSFGSSQNLQSVSVAAAVSGGTTYWVVIEAAGGGATWGALNLNNNGSGQNQAYNPGSGWVPGFFQGCGWQTYVGSSGPSLAKTGGTCPGSMSYQVTGATPGGQVGLIFSASTGSFVIPGSFACAGTTLGLGSSGIQLVANTAADGSGTANFRGNAPQSACNRFLQGIDVTTCGTTNVVQIN